MNVLTRLALALVCGGVVFALVQAATSVLIRRNAPRTALVLALLEEQAKLERRASLSERVRYRLAEAGYSGTLGVLAVTGALLFSLTTLLLRLIGLDGLYGLGAAAAASATALWLVASRYALKRKRMFDEQLLAALKMMAAQLEGGSGIQRAIDIAAASSSEPLSSELKAAVDAAVANQNLIGSLKQLRDRYPSRAFDLFIAALEIDDSLGGRIEPSLRRASEMMQREFDLAAEAKAEVAQARYEFYAVIVLMAIVAASLLRSTANSADGVWTSALGVVGLVGGFGNFAVGVLRGRRLLNRVEGGSKSPVPRSAMKAQQP